jgi:hypothetical protein
MRSWIARRSLRAFAKHFRYDISYLEMMLDQSPCAFFKFAPVRDNPAPAAAPDNHARVLMAFGEAGNVAHLAELRGRTDSS